MRDRYIIKHIRLYGEEGFSEPNELALMISKEKIEDICPEGTETPEGWETMDGEGAYVIPGLIDCHNHLALDVELPGYLERMNHSETELAMIAFRTLQKDLASGVTTSRCMGDRNYLDVFCKNAIKNGMLEGPELFVAGIGMKASHGHGYVGLPFDGEDELIRAVRKNVFHGADWIKYFSTASTPMADRKRIQSFYSQGEIAAVINEAHRSGKKVTSHCIGGEALQNSVKHGIDCVEHIYFADEADIETLLAHHTPVCLTPTEYFADNENAPAGYHSNMVSYRQEVRANMERAIAAGIPFVLGTDGSHGKLWLEASLAVEFGAKPEEVLKAATERAARLLGIDQHTGKIQKGYDADLVLLKGNPLENIENLREVKAVYKKGALVTAAKKED